jgi:hypothetical protein
LIDFVWGVFEKSFQDHAHGEEILLWEIQILNGFFQEGA